MHLVDFLWSLLVIFFMVVYFIMLFRVVIDVFRSDDLSGWGKALWLLALLAFPLVTLLVYVISRGDGIAGRDRRQYQLVQQAQEQYIRAVAAGSGSSTGSAADQIARAHELLAAGAITQEEFDTLKSRALSG